MVHVALVGAGYFSRFHLDAWCRLPGVRVVALCDLDGQRAETLAREFGVPETFEDVEDMLDRTAPDLVDIAVPPAGHGSIIAAVSKRGLPMICQKPFCGSLAEARKATELAERGGSLLVVHENFRFQPWYGAIRAQIDSGALGALYQIRFDLRPGDGQGADAYLDRQPYFRTMERFLVHETAIHLIDVMRYLLGEARAVSADLRRHNRAIAGEDAGLIVLDFGDGRRGVFDGNRLVDHVAENRRLTMGEMLVEGERAVLRLNGDGQVFKRAHGSDQWSRLSFDWNPGEEEPDAFGGDCVYRLQKHVVDHLVDGTPIQNTARAYLENLRIEEAVYRSHAERRWVDLDG